MIIKITIKNKYLIIWINKNKFLIKFIKEFMNQKISIE